MTAGYFRVALCALALAACSVAGAAEPALRWKNWSYDVPYVPTPQVVVDEMLRVAGVGPQDTMMDLGSGDGRILITAASKFGARGVGVELDEELLARSADNAREAGVSGRVTFVRQDLFKTDLSGATVISMYLLPTVNMRLRPVLLGLKPGTRIVSHDFDLGEWLPDRKVTIRKNVFLWIVPAQAGGKWQAAIALEDGEQKFEFDFRQRFQVLDGVARINGVMSQLWESAVSGERVSFVVVDNRDRENEANLYFEGRVQGGVMEGELRRGVGNAMTRHMWRAVRVGD
jgi:SAM-dependent methyltransferase